MMRSLYSGVAGMKGHQTRMDVIGNNIANVNTTGFKASRTTFSDTLNQTTSDASAANNVRGGINPKQVGLGTGVASIDLLFTDSTTQATGKNTDLALTGNALFILKQGNEKYYTRDGAFEFDEAGNYVLPGSGLYVQGWMATNGVLDTRGTQTSKITIPPGKSMAPEITETISCYNNLNSAEPTITRMTLRDENGDSIVIHSTSTTSYTVGKSTFSSQIDNVAVEFANGITLPSAAGAYTKGGTCAVSGSSTITLSNGDTISAPNTSTHTYTIGSALGSELSVNSVTGTRVVLSDGTTLTNNSSTTYSVALSTSSNAPTITIRNQTYTYTGTGTPSIAIDPSSAIAYATNTALPTPLTFGGTAPSNNTVVLSDRSTLDLVNIDDWTYIDSTTGATVKLAETDISGAGANSVSLGGTAGSIDGLPTTASVSSIAGTIISSDDGTLDTFTITKSGGYLNPSERVTVSKIALETADGSVSISNRDTSYKVGNTYTSKAIKSITADLSDGTENMLLASGTYRMGYSLPLSTSFTVYDSLGNAHDLILYFTKTSADTWNVSLNPDGSGTKTLYEGDGETVKLIARMSDFTLRFDESGAFSTVDGANVITLAPQNGAEPDQSITIDLNTLTQYSGSNTIYGNADGHSAGTLKSITIDDTGVITGVYTNNVHQIEAQVAVAMFTNASGLTKVGNSFYQASNNSGSDPEPMSAADIGVTISAGSLEMSNVDLANEFTDMIVTQRGFQSSSKIINVGDEMLETLINLKR